MKKKIPTFKTDEEAERFVDTADLSKYDLTVTPQPFPAEWLEGGFHPFEL